MSYQDTPKMCRCNRPEVPQHCVACGSTNLYGREANSIFLDIPKQDGGGKIKARGFRCRKCLTDFHEAMPCEAPRWETKSMKAKRLEDKAQESTAEAIERAGGRLAFLTDLYRAKGLMRPEDVAKALDKVPEPPDEG